MTAVAWSVVATIAIGISMALWLQRYRNLLIFPIKVLIICGWSAAFFGAAAILVRDWYLLVLSAVIALVSFFAYYFAYRYYYRERIVLVSERNEPIGVACKLPAHNAQTARHRAFSVFLFNNKGHVLIQQRALHKKTWPGVWSNSCCGHVMLYETEISAAYRRIKYELGITGVILHMMIGDYKYRAEKDGVVENEFCPVLVGLMSDETVRPNPQEISAVEWIPWKIFLKNCRESPDLYSPWAVEEALLLDQNEEFRSLLSRHVSIEY